MSVLEAIERIEKAVADHDAAEQRRMDNMFYGSPGIEERIEMVNERARFTLWALGRICIALKEERQSEGEDV